MPNEVFPVQGTQRSKQKFKMWSRLNGQTVDREEPNSWCEDKHQWPLQKKKYNNSEQVSLHLNYTEIKSKRLKMNPLMQYLLKLVEEFNKFLFH